MVDPQDWRELWEGVQPGFEEYFRSEAQDSFTRLSDQIVLEPQMHVLDFGCGFGYLARRIADKVASVSLWDFALNIRHQAFENVKGHERVRFLDLSDDSGLELCSDSFDIVLVNSVIQYMTIEEFLRWLKRWYSMLRSGGVIIISDVIPQDSSAIWELMASLHFHARNGHLWRAIHRSVRRLLRYQKTRRRVPLQRYAWSTIEALATDAGMIATRVPTNLTYRQERMTALLRPF